MVSQCSVGRNSRKEYRVDINVYLISTLCQYKFLIDNLLEKNVW